MPPTRRERLERITSYPLLWAGVYVLWLGFGALLLFWRIAVKPPSLAWGALVAMGVLPIAFVSLSHWMQRAYDPDRSR